MSKFITHKWSVNESGRTLCIVISSTNRKEPQGLLTVLYLKTLSNIDNNTSQDYQSDITNHNDGITSHNGLLSTKQGEIMVPGTSQIFKILVSFPYCHGISCCWCLYIHKN